MRLTVIFIPGNDTSETDSSSGLAFQLLGDLSAEEQHWIAWPLQTRTEQDCMKNLGRLVSA